MSLLFAIRLRADTTATNVDSFQAALEETVSNGGGTILVTQPIVIDSTADSFDGQSNVLVSGGGTNSIFNVTNGGSLFLANMTLANGRSTNSGGAIFITSDSMLTVSNCVFSNNVVIGASGLSASTNSPANSPIIGGDGRSGTAGRSVSGGAIYNLGSLTVLDCQFLTNSAIGGSGGDGGAGVTGTTQGGNGGRGGNGGGAAGGGIYDAGASLVIADSTFSANLAQGGSGGAGGGAGGGIVSGQAAGGGTGGDAAGAGLYTRNTNGGISACTFANNTAQGGNSADGGTSAGGNGQDGRRGGNALGAGIDNGGFLSITNSTFFQNIASGGTGGNGGSGAGGGNGGNGGSATGGSLYNAGTVFVLNCTFSMGGAIGGTNGSAGAGIASGSNGGIGARRGGNIANVARKKKGSFILANSILGKTSAGPGSFGTIKDGGFNISADKSIPFKPAKKGGTSLMNTNPLPGNLSPADHGGFTQTIALPTNSLAVDFINPTNLITPDVDQRGKHRPLPVFRDWSDAGAFEVDTNEITILTQPQSISVPAGSNATFTVSAQGPILGYQWYFNPSNLPPSALTDPSNILTGETSTNLTITNVQSANQGFYIVIVTNTTDAATSKVASLTITTGPAITALTITPTNGSVPLGSNATISVTATGASPLAYQWFFFAQTNSMTNALSNTGNISGSTSSNLLITGFQTANAGNYFVVVTNVAGSVTSQVASLTTTVASNSRPVITSTNLTPSNGAVFQGSNAAMSVTVLSASPVVYQWFFVQTNSAITITLTDNPAIFPGNIIGSTSNLLTITNFDFQPAQNEGIYFVVVTNAFGSTTSGVFALTLNTGGGIIPAPVTFLDKSLQGPGQPSLAPPGMTQDGSAVAALPFQPRTSQAPVLESSVNFDLPGMRPNWKRNLADRLKPKKRLRTNDHSPPPST